MEKLKLNINVMRISEGVVRGKPSVADSGQSDILGYQSGRIRMQQLRNEALSTNKSHYL